MKLSSLCVLLVASCAWGQEYSQPIVTIEPVTKKVYRCAEGWKLQVWERQSWKWSSDKGMHSEIYGYSDTHALGVYSDAIDYVDIPAHPPRCVKDEKAEAKPAKLPGGTMKGCDRCNYYPNGHSVTTVTRKEKK
jgi:hypothetical protein